MQLLADAVAALVVLVAAIALSVYKPQGVTPFGRVRRLSGVDAPRRDSPRRRRLALLRSGAGSVGRLEVEAFG
ncbi:hypothetical protein [Saccharothrix hoggarensis]|uniref:Uncharacterized protein n=1 Tax=Saccharothrix hoggarensis TaxID=913853 RepID=A0ABW3R0S8_9PSEU